MAKLVRREVILLKIESTYNVDALPTAVDDALLVENPSWSLEGLRMGERAPVRQSIGKLQSIYGGTMYSVTFDVEIKGSGVVATPPEIGQALRACAMGETIIAATSVAYSPVSTGHESATIYYYEDGSLYKLTGCRGNLSGNTETGIQGKLSMTFTGHLAEKIDAALVTPSYDTVVPAPAINAPFTVGGFASTISAMSFDLGNEIATPPNISAIDGYGEVIVGMRDVNGSFDPEATTIAEKDWLSELQASTSQALVLGPIGNVAGNIYQIDMPAISYRELSQGDKENLRTYEIGFGAAESTTDDELTITFT